MRKKPDRDQDSNVGAWKDWLIFLLAIILYAAITLLFGEGLS